MSKNHILKVRVYYEDTDAGGVVYYANYLKFTERARTELLRSLGLENTALRDAHGILLVVRRVEADYLASARLDDELGIYTSISEIRNTSLVMKQAIRRGETVLFDSDVTVACVGEKDGQFKPVRLPTELKKALEGMTE